jgi:hypothetical protein
MFVAHGLQKLHMSMIDIRQSETFAAWFADLRD